MNAALAVTPGYLQLGCFKGKPSVGLAFAFDVGNAKDSEFGYRFDAKPGRQIDPRFLSNHRTIVIEAKADVERFAVQLIASNVLLVQIRSLTEGQTSAEFQVNGAQAAIDAAFAGCPLPLMREVLARTRNRWGGFALVCLGKIAIGVLKSRL